MKLLEGIIKFYMINLFKQIAKKMKYFVSGFLTFLFVFYIAFLRQFAIHTPNDTLFFILKLLLLIFFILIIFKNKRARWILSKITRIKSKIKEDKF